MGPALLPTRLNHRPASLRSLGATRQRPAKKLRGNTAPATRLPLSWKAPPSSGTVGFAGGKLNRAAGISLVLGRKLEQSPATGG